MSYKALSRGSIERGNDRLTIIEDDVTLDEFL